MNKEVLNFIEQFLGGQYASKHDRELLVDKFTAGYCYYFAHILQTAFERGIVCWAAPLNHFVWKDSLDGQAYDINGCFNPKERGAMYLIPENFAEAVLSEYKHVGQAPAVSKEQIIDVVKHYCKAYDKAYQLEIEDYLV